MPVQLLLKKVNLFPLGAVPSGANALLIQDGLIAAMGRGRELSKALGPHARVINLKGRTVVPGFIDTHVHLAETGLLRQGVDLSSAETLEQSLEILKDAFVDRPDSGFFRAHSLDPSLMRGGRYPTREELDAISSRVPILILRRDGHSCVCNSVFFQHCGLNGDVPGVELDPRTNRPTGTLRAQALERARACRNRLLGTENRAQAMRDACWLAVSKGVTTVHAICARPEDVDLLDQLAEELPVEVVAYLSVMDVEAVRLRGLPRIGGDLLVDGSLGSHTAALFQPYADRPDEHGQLYLQPGELVSFVRRAHEIGLQVSLHAIGDRAVEEALSSYESALDVCPRLDHRHRMEHAELLHPDQIRRIADRGIVLAVQPAFEAFWGGSEGMYASRLGPERVRMTNPFRHLVDQGVILAGGSDSYVTPIDPLAGIAAAVNHPHPDHRLSPPEAVRMFTANGAFAAFQEREKGALQVGMRADLTVLSRDPRQVSPEDISRIAITMVICGGRVTFPRPTQKASHPAAGKK